MPRKCEHRLCWIKKVLIVWRSLFHAPHHNPHTFRIRHRFDCCFRPRCSLALLYQPAANENPATLGRRNRQPTSLACHCSVTCNCSIEAECLVPAWVTTKDEAAAQVAIGSVHIQQQVPRRPSTRYYNKCRANNWHNCSIRLRSPRPHRQLEQPASVTSSCVPAGLLLRIYFLLQILIFVSPC